VRTTRVAAGVAVAALSLLAAAPAGAWPAPTAYSTGGGCTGSVRAPIMWAITNLETELPRSPAHIENVTVTPSGFTTPGFLPLELPNNGTTTATTFTDVPPTFSGAVTLAFRLVWAGLDGTDFRDGTISTTVSPCPQSPPPPPPPTTTTVTSTTTTTIPGVPVQFTVPPESTSTTTTTVATTPTTPTTEAVAAEAVEADVVPVVAVRPIAVTATPTFTG
jgi:hypothetical protein